MDYSFQKIGIWKILWKSVSKALKEIMKEAKESLNNVM